MFFVDIFVLELKRRFVANSNADGLQPDLYSTPKREVMPLGAQLHFFQPKNGTVD